MNKNSSESESPDKKLIQKLNEIKISSNNEKEIHLPKVKIIDVQSNSRDSNQNKNSVNFNI